jgi:hypothetical protein
MFPTIYNQSFLNPKMDYGLGLSNPNLPLGISSSTSDLALPGGSNLKIPDPPIIEKKGTNFNWISYVLIFFLFVFFVVIIILLFINTSTKSKYIKPENCPSIKSNYASIPSVPSTSLSTVSSCSGNPDGYQGTQPCIFNNITNLYDAQNLCNKYQNSICSGFYYNTNTQQVNFIKTGFTITSSTPVSSSVDVYLKQNS